MFYLSLFCASVSKMSPKVLYFMPSQLKEKFPRNILLLDSGGGVGNRHVPGYAASPSLEPGDQPAAAARLEPQMPLPREWQQQDSAQQL